MAEKEIALLKQRIDRLGDKNFDLDAWKNHTLIFLERIFGKDSSKIRMIKKLAYDYSSWSLRDTAAAGKTKDKDPVRLQAEEILQAAVTELENLGLPDIGKGKAHIWQLLEDNLTGKKVKELEALSQSEDADRNEKMEKIITQLGDEKMVAIIVQLLLG
ncbi:MAG: hypothetical protein CSA36_00250 [Draconibacterium sp.]|nr:MAG: hypothetical protein CSA36_00250 [Draconibacterium sp.]